MYLFSTTLIWQKFNCSLFTINTWSITLGLGSVDALGAVWAVGSLLLSFLLLPGGL